MTTLVAIDPSRIQRLEESLAVRPDFLAELETTDDWSYVVKTHTLIESALTQRLLSAVARSELDAVLHGLELGTHRRGKIAFVRALRLLGDADIRFIRFLEEVRASLLWSSRSTSFTFTDYFEPRPDPQLQQLYWSWGIPRLGGEEGALLRRVFRARPRFLIHLMVVGLLERIHGDPGQVEPMEEPALLALLRRLDEPGA